MTWRWLRVRGEGSSLVHHAVSGWPYSLDTACGWQGSGKVDIEIDPQGERHCLSCKRKLLSAEGA